jgi:hypothetical protein
VADFLSSSGLGRFMLNRNVRCTVLGALRAVDPIKLLSDLDIIHKVLLLAQVQRSQIQTSSRERDSMFSVGCQRQAVCSTVHAKQTRHVEFALAQTDASTSSNASPKLLLTNITNSRSTSNFTSTLTLFTTQRITKVFTAYYLLFRGRERHSQSQTPIRPPYSLSLSCHQDTHGRVSQ